VVVFDTAPTGHTIRLLELPVDWSKHIEESSKGSGQTCMGPVQLIQESKQKYDDAIAKLRDPAATDFIFVLQPEQTSLEETKRSSGELGEIGIKTTHLIVNGLIPAEEAVNPFFKQRYEMQQQHLAEICKTFGGIPVKTMELFDNELKGLDIVGKSNVSKTTLLEKLLVELKKRGYRVAIVKHDIHGFNIDQPGKDTW